MHVLFKLYGITLGCVFYVVFILAVQQPHLFYYFLSMTPSLSFSLSLSQSLSLSRSLSSSSNSLFILTILCISQHLSLFSIHVIFLPLSLFLYFCFVPSLSLSCLSQSIFLAPSYHPYVAKFRDYLLTITITKSNLSAFAVSIRPYVN